MTIGEGVVVSPLVAAAARQRAAVPGWLGAAVQALLGLEVLMCLTRAGFDALAVKYWDEVAAGRWDAGGGARRILALVSTGAADEVLFLLTAVVFIAWLYQAHRAAQAVAPDRLDRGPGWVVGSWFVPIGSFWLPYRSVREIWRASGAWQGQGERSGLVLLWWLLFVVGQWPRQLTGGLAPALVTYPGAEADLYAFWGVLSLTEAAAAVSAVVMVRRLTRMQRAAADGLSFADRLDRPVQPVAGTP